MSIRIHTIARTACAVGRIQGYTNGDSDEIRASTFAQEWEAEREAGYPVFKRLKAEAFAHEINQVEERLLEITRAA